MAGKLFPTLLLTVALLLAAGAVLADSGPYLSVQAIGVFAEDSDANILEDMEFDTGIGGAAALGYDHGWRYGHARTEVELAYRTSEIDEARLFGQTESGDGDVSAWSLMANAVYVFDNPTPVRPYLMAGLGAAWVNIDNAEAAGVTVIDDDQPAFAYQGGAGLDIVLNDVLSIDLAYRYFRTANNQFENDIGDDFDFGYKSHNAALGFRLKF